MAVALGTLAPVRGVALAGGVDVKTVTLFITAKFTCCATLVALGTVKSGRGPGCCDLKGFEGPPKIATPPVDLGAGFRVGVGTVGILNGCFEVVAKSTG